MYTFSIVMIVIASILLILAVLVQSPKSGMAANFGAANQTMGVRQTTNFLEKFTWAMIACIVFFALLSVVSMPKKATEQAVIGTEEISAALAEGEAVVEEVVAGEDDIVVEADAEAAVATEETTEEVAEEVAE